MKLLGVFLALITSGAVSASIDPQIFSPGVISSGAHDSAPAFSPDGRELYFGRSTPAASFILSARRVRRGWSRPEVAPFSGQWLDMEPAMAPDGSYLIFVSNRPVKAGGAPIDGRSNGQSQPGKGGNLWRVNHEAGGWGRPQHLSPLINDGGSIYAPSIAADGTLYFMKPSAETGRFQLFRAPRSGTGYETPQPLPFSDGSTTDVDPAVAPDQSYIVFGSGRRANKDIDLFIAHRGPSGWMAPVYLGEPLNSRTSDAEPRLSPDGRVLYFSSERMAPVASPSDQADATKLVAEMSAWNNGLYNIWRADIRPLLAMKDAPLDDSAPRHQELADESGVRMAEQRWSEAFVSGDAVA